MLTVSAISTGYGNVEVLKEVSLSVAEGEIISVIGANGAGKTTLMACLAGIQPIWGGSVILDSVDVSNARPNVRVSKGLVLVPEGRKIFSRLTVLGNLRLGAYLRDDKSDEILERVFTLFPILRDRLKQLGGTLSGGEQQMLAIGRALMSRPKVLLMDEPSMGVAPILVQRIFETIRELNQGGLTIILVEQNARLALKVSHRAYVLELGSVILSDSAAALANDSRVREAYLGGEL